MSARKGVGQPNRAFPFTSAVFAAFFLLYLQDHGKRHQLELNQLERFALPGQALRTAAAARGDR